MTENRPGDELVDRAVCGDRAALERLLLDHHGELARHLACRLPPSIQAVVGVDDLVQQTYAQVFAAISKLEPRGVAAFWSWLLTIADNRLCDAIRSHHRQKRAGERRQIVGGVSAEQSALDLLDALADSATSPSWCAARHEAVAAVKRVLAELPEDHRRALELHHFDGYSLEETAALMGRTTGAVRGLLDRGKDKLRDALERASRYLG